ncbi:MAG: hypothetical protein WC855_13145 [Thermodesulfovibrionales bacterium]
MNEQLEILLKEGQGFTFQNNCYSLGHGTYSKASDEYQAWIARVEDFILEYYGEESAPFRLYKKFDRRYIDGHDQNSFDKQHVILIASLKACTKITPKKKPVDLNKEYSLLNLFDNFHSVVRQLRSRYSNRPTLEVDDEYDVQDLLHCLLRLHFDDIRKEEWSPSYAGGSSRMDFLLKEEQIVIEVKKTRKGLADKELGRQLIEDKEKYKQHPNCKKLICFTYDPEGRITNPKGIMNDLNIAEEKFRVEIIIRP